MGGGDYRAACWVGVVGIVEEVGVEGDDDVEFEEEGDEAGEEDAEGGVGVKEARGAEGEFCAAAEERRDVGGVGRDFCVDVSRDAAVVEQNPAGSAEGVYADGEGVDVVTA